MSSYFKSFSVKLIKDHADIEDWKETYKVLMVDMEKQATRVLKEDKGVTDHKTNMSNIVKPELIEDEDDEVAKTEHINEDYEDQESIQMWCLIGNKSGELRWFDIKELQYIET